MNDKVGSVKEKHDRRIGSLGNGLFDDRADFRPSLEKLRSILLLRNLIPWLLWYLKKNALDTKGLKWPDNYYTNVTINITTLIMVGCDFQRRS